MTIISQISSSLNRRDEVPNQELARHIVNNADSEAVKELVDNLNNKSTKIQNDCIKVLYEIGYQKPELIAAYVNEFISLLDNRNNRLQWGGMTALSTITNEAPEIIYSVLPQIMEAADKGSVITRDSAVNILISLSALKPYATSAFALLLEQILKSPVNQLPMYAERAMMIISDTNKDRFVQILKNRLNDIESESKRKRVEKVIKKLS